MVKKNEKPLWIYFLSLAVFVLAMFIAAAIGVGDYINDSMFMMLILTVLFFSYNTLKLKPWIYLSVTFAFLLHNLGMFGYYAASPISLQWDHLTHLVGEFVAGIAVYNYFYAAGILNRKKTKTEKFTLLMFIVFAAIGVGVIVEFMEFWGYFYVGEGMGIFAHGIGDINTEFMNSEWFNTMFDLIYNTAGALLGVLFCRYGLKDKYLRKPGR
tara:strand:- start:1095 stop:1730 length:636 start_codon:yes stop_codon:yes gene_type:complete